MNPGHAPALVSNERKLSVIVDAMPAEAAECPENGSDGLAIFFSVTMLDRGGTAESPVRLDADDGGVALQIDPVPPGLGFVTWFEVFLAQCGEHLLDGGGWFGFGKLDEGFHVGDLVRGGSTVRSMNDITPQV